MITETTTRKINENIVLYFTNIEPISYKIKSTKSGVEVWVFDAKVNFIRGSTWGACGNFSN